MTQAKMIKVARELRRDVLQMIYEAKSGHPGGSLGLTDLFTALYFKILKYDSQNTDWEDRDRLILSCGHVCPILYATMIKAGILPNDFLNKLRKINSPLQGHPGKNELGEVETSTGPLGQGISVAVGEAIAAKMDKKDYFVYCVTSDGEQQEGQTWEAYMLAAKMKLDNLIFFLDRNDIQISGTTEKIMNLEPLKKKYQAFNFRVWEIDGHNISKIISTVSKAKKVKGKPIMIILKTVLGKGVSFMENNYLWHGKAPNLEELNLALNYLK